jgi:hypothetical protein
VGRIGEVLEEESDEKLEVKSQKSEVSSSLALISICVGVGYAAVGVLFALPASHVQVWRLAAWAVCGVVYAGHIIYERFRQRGNPAVAAWHVAVAVAIGACGLAVGAIVHSLLVESMGPHRQLLLLSLVLWPALTAVPAFVVAFAASVVLGRVLGNR